MTSSIRRGNDEFYGLREYRAGDNVRSIHWRSTARTGRLTIREMASNAPPQMIIVLNLPQLRTTANAAVEIERAVELAASLLCYAFLENFAVALAIPGQPTEAPPIPHMGRERAPPSSIASQHSIPKRCAKTSPYRCRTVSAPAPNGPSSPSTAPIPSRSLSAHASKTVLSLDAPESEEWIHFISRDETLRIA